ncbi:PREDICTED: LOC110756416 [Prunus dulcis]|uniref:PREDICTED: LOC110756416 n=1 Tax=Prunus dulcis TaxID=3755 RepID=A0A5E4FHZ6_PRUDU|nr:PREDICTED: LOC110756416 [Prunus dulcis]
MMVKVRDGGETPRCTDPDMFTLEVHHRGYFVDGYVDVDVDVDEVSMLELRYLCKHLGYDEHNCHFYYKHKTKDNGYVDLGDVEMEAQDDEDGGYVYVVDVEIEEEDDESGQEDGEAWQKDVEEEEEDGEGDEKDGEVKEEGGDFIDNLDNLDGDDENEGGKVRGLRQPKFKQYHKEHELINSKFHVRMKFPNIGECRHAIRGDAKGKDFKGKDNKGKDAKGKEEEELESFLSYFLLHMLAKGLL